MIYFKIEDFDTMAGTLFEDFTSDQQQAAQMAGKLMDELGIEADNFEYNGSGQCIGFPHRSGQPVPEGMRVIDGTLRPHRRNKTGKRIHKRMKKIKLPTGSDLMRILVGAVGQHIEGRNLRHGMSCSMKEDIVLLTCHPKVWEDAQSKKDFEVPEGLEEITYSEYQELNNQ